ncbi:hypothetical protein G3M58_10160 [Streptomyces sp. SID7499]|uniref:SseB family protein n=1 Tax=Streptomyces sp. SID7499 TaxID=2706086 RepID=A0A6G3WMY0_9ACTN|nr:hypothetical protein [Streptomyces sp. SID7499]
MRRSRLAEYAELTVAPDRQPGPATSGSGEGTRPAEPGRAPRPTGAPEATEVPSLTEAPEPTEAEVAARRRAFAMLLKAFRDTAVLVPTRDGGWLTADFGGIRWILAFSDESALSRYALARDEADREWTYRTVLGARLLDVAVPEAGVPCGVALDAADGAEHALLLPPVTGIVPDAFAVDHAQQGGMPR